MPLWQSGLNFVTNRMPKVIGPKAHAALDYAIAGAFLIAAARFWNSNRRAALGSLLCGGATLATSLLTEYPGGTADMIDYETHGRIDAGIATLSAAMPRFMGFAGEDEARFFGAQALVATTVASLTRYEHTRETRLASSKLRRVV